MIEAVLDHGLLQELVAAFADGELPDAEARVVEAHLRGCVRCQRELALQRGLSAALVQHDARSASHALRNRIDQIGRPTSPPLAFAWKSWVAPALATGFVAFVVVSGAAFVSVSVGRAGALSARRGEENGRITAIALLRDARDDCRRAMTRNFPRKADVEAVSAGLEFPVRVLGRPDTKLFSTWKTTLAGTPAVGLAYRWRGIIVVQYAVSAEMMWRQPEIADALRLTGLYSVSEHGQAIVASLADGGGTLLIADTRAEELRRLLL
jgi:hypothetical protein